MSQARNTKRKWNEFENKENVSPSILSKKSPLTLMRSALQERLTSLQQEEKDIIIKFTEAILQDRDYVEFSQQMKSKQKEIMHIKNKLKHMDEIPQLVLPPPQKKLGRGLFNSRSIYRDEEAPAQNQNKLPQ